MLPAKGQSTRVKDGQIEFQRYKLRQYAKYRAAKMPWLSWSEDFGYLAIAVVSISWILRKKNLRRCWPVHVNPFPVNPSSQAQVKFPVGSSVQVACWLQPPLLTSHSFVSATQHGTHETLNQWLKCNRTQLPYLQKMAQGVPAAYIFYGRIWTVVGTIRRHNVGWLYSQSHFIMPDESIFFAFQNASYFPIWAWVVFVLDAMMS